MCAAGSDNLFVDFLTANEGDGREYGEEDTPEFFTDEIRVADLAVELGLDATAHPYTDDALGRLKVRLGRSLLASGSAREGTRGRMCSACCSNHLLREPSNLREIVSTSRRPPIVQGTNAFP